MHTRIRSQHTDTRVKIYSNLHIYMHAYKTCIHTDMQTCMYAADFFFQFQVEFSRPNPDKVLFSDVHSLTTCAANRAQAVRRHTLNAVYN